MAKKKNKQIIRPWCWYCEREFEDEKVLMQHQKAKHFKCNMCPRRLNTAGGLAVHIQQVHKLEPDNLPRIDNALPGRDGYEVEIFGMEGIPAPDVADYKRRKEIELGLSAGSISQPPAKRPKVENRPLTESELKAQLEAHKALMGAHDTSSSSAPATDGSTGGVYGAGPQTYAAPPAPSPMPPPSAMSPPLGMPPGGPPFFPGGPPPPGAFPGQPPFPPFPGGMPGFPPGPPPPGFPMPPGFPPVGMIPPGALQFPPPPIPIRPPFPPPQLLPPHVSPPFPPPLMAGSPPPPSASPPNPHPNPTSLNQQPPPGTLSMSPQPPAAPPIQGQLVLPNPALRQTLPDLKKKTALKYDDANFSPEEKRGRSSRYYVAAGQDPTAPSADEPRGTKRARAEDFL